MFAAPSFIVIRASSATVDALARANIVAIFTKTTTITG
jgi:hypothetical protein